MDDDSASPFVDDVAAPAREAAGTPWQILIVDDEPEVHDVTKLALSDVVFSNRPLLFLNAHSAAEARAVLAENREIALVLLDVVMESDDAGLTLIRHIRKTLGDKLVRIVLRTGQPGQAPERAVIRDYDISDYCTKTDMTSTRLYTTVITALRAHHQLFEIAQLKAALEDERDYLREEVNESRGDLVTGASPSFRSVLVQLEAVAPSDATVLVLGESGVGKEVIARAIHERSSRAAGPLVTVNCAGVPRELFESEFFGHVRGSFTGAHKDRVGRFALADRGTLFLDEVGEIPIELQSKLLRALQEREFERVGDTAKQRADVRVIAATNQDLQRAINEGRFRADLYFRLNVFPLNVPPLRERREDIVPLFEHALAKICRRYGRRVPSLSREQMLALSEYGWPGNVRELQNVVERAVLLMRGEVLALELALPAFSSSASSAATPGAPPGRTYLTADEMKEFEKKNLLAALDAAGWKISGEGGAAELLGIKPSTLAYQMRTFGIDSVRSRR